MISFEMLFNRAEEMFAVICYGCSRGSRLDLIKLTVPPGASAEKTGLQVHNRLTLKVFTVLNPLSCVIIGICQSASSVNKLPPLGR